MSEKTTSQRPRATARKKKKSKALIAALIAIVIVVGGTLGGVAAWKNTHQSVVNVYDFSNIGMTEYWGDQSESDGPISADDLQTVYLSETQTLSEILVTEGQQVKKGDALFTYDSTLTQLDVDRAEISLQQKQLDLENAKKELATVKTYRAGVAIPGSSTWVPGDDGGTDSDDVTYTLSPASGSGTSSDPYVYDWSTVEEFNGGAFDDSTLSELAHGKADAYVILRLPSGGTDEPEEPDEPDTPVETTDPTDQPEPSQEPTTPAETEPAETPSASVETETTYDEVTPLNAAGASVMKLQIQNQDGAYTYTILSVTVNGQEVTLSDPQPAVEEQEKPETTPTPGYWTEGITYTAAEIAQMTAEKEQAVRTAELDIRSAELSLKKLTDEANNDTVYSEMDGTVVLLNDPEAIDTKTTPLVKVSADGSYTVTAVLGEMDLGKVTVGQEVTVNVYGEESISTTGTITAISEYPTDGTNYYYSNSGNTNISYYPFTVTIDGAENLREGDYAEIYYDVQEESSDSVYLENSFVLSENGKSYVYVYQENGTIKKQEVSTGKDLWGSYTEIKSGITSSDYLAFPYGTAVKDGAKAQIADINELYS